MLEINNIPIPTPSAFKVGINEISNAERNANGDMMKDRIAIKRKLEMSWKCLEPEPLSELLKLIDDTFFFVKYPDPKTGLLETKTFYCGDINVDMYAYRNGNPVWEGISFNFIEK